MTNSRWFLMLAMSALAACSHAPDDRTRYVLTVEYNGQRVFDPSPIRMEGQAIPLGGTCPEPIVRDRVLNLQLREPFDGYFSYSCYSSCWFGVGEGSVGKIAPGESVSLECHGASDEELQVTLREG